MTVNEELRLLRLKKRITLTELAKVLKCSISHISNYENGRFGMSHKNKEKYKKYIQKK